MAKTIFGKMCKLFSVFIAAAVLAGCVFMFTACESKNPEIRMTISFNGEEYVLEYKLYRNYAPQTVAHYIELIDADYFDGTVIHDYKDGDRMIGGGFTYEGGDMDGGDVVDDLVQLDYDAATTDGNGNVTLENISLWSDADCTQPMNRLYGETSKNGFSVDNGGLRNQFGALGTYTYAYDVRQSEVIPDYVYAPGSGDSASAMRYAQNSFQGMFYIYLGSGGGSETDYCIFGELKDDASNTALTDLETAIDDYVADEANNLDSFTEEMENSTVLDSMIQGGSYEVTDNFDVPQVRIIITDVTVTKY